MSDRIEHPRLGPLVYHYNDRAWIGRAGIHEISVGGDSWEMDPACEALAVAELAELDRLLGRIAEFLASVREPYLDRWVHRVWEVNSLLFRREEEGSARFIAEYLLERDEYTVWQVEVREGVPTALGRR